MAYGSTTSLVYVTSFKGVDLWLDAVLCAEAEWDESREDIYYDTLDYEIDLDNWDCIRIYEKGTDNDITDKVSDRLIDRSFEYINNHLTDIYEKYNKKFMKEVSYITDWGC